MKRVLKPFLRTKTRSFATSGFSKLVEPLQEFSEAKELSNSEAYSALQKLYRYDLLTKKRAGEIEDLAFRNDRAVQRYNQDGVALDFVERPAAETLRRYFAARRELGVNETLVRSAVKSLAKLAERDSSARKIKDDLFGRFLKESPLFAKLLRDVLMLTEPRLEVDLEQFGGVFEELAKLGFKDLPLFDAALQKLSHVLSNETSSAISTEKFEHLLPKGLGNHSRVPQKGVFREFLDQVMAAERAPEGPRELLRRIRRAEEPEAREDLGQLLDRLEGLAANYKDLHLDFLETVSDARRHYFDLRDQDKQDLIRDNPEVYLDFLSLEKQLLICGLLMPKDLLDTNAGDMRSLSLAVEQIVFENRVDPGFLSDLLNTRFKKGKDFSPEQKEAFELLTKEENEQSQNQNQVVEKSETQIDKSLQASYFISALEGLFAFAQERVGCKNPHDDYPFESFAHIFGERYASPKDFDEIFYGKKMDDIFESPSLIDKERAKHGLFYYTKAFHALQDFFSSFYSRAFETKGSGDLFTADDLSVGDLLRVNAFAQKMIDQKVIDETRNLLAKKIEEAESISESVAEILAKNTTFLDADILFSLLKKMNLEEVLENPIFDKLKSLSGEQDEIIDLAFLLFALRKSHVAPEHNLKIDHLIQNLANKSFLEKIYSFDYEKKLPLSPNFFKIYYILDYLRSFEKKHGSDIQELLEKSTAKISQYLSVNFPLILTADPAYSLVLNSLARANFENDNNLLDLQLKSQAPVSVAPEFFAQSSDSSNAIFLIFPYQHKNSIDIFVRKEFLKNKINNIKFEVVSPVDFFEHSNYFRELDFTLSKNIDEIAEKIWKKHENLEKNPVEGFEEVFSIFKSNKLEISKVSKSKAKLFSIFVELEKALRNTNSRQDPERFRTVLNSVLFFGNLLKESLDEILTGQQKSVISSFIENIRGKLSEIPASEKNFDFGFIGKRFSLEKTKAEKTDGLLHFEFLNYKSFDRPDYFIMDSWQRDLGDFLDPLQFRQQDESFYTENGRFQRFLLPNAGGRQITLPGFQFFWEELAYSNFNEGEKQKAIYLETLASINNFSKLSEQGRWKVALLNFAYQFRTKGDLDKMIKGIFSCDFWTKLIQQSLSYKGETQNGDVIKKKIILNDEIFQSDFYDKSANEKTFFDLDSANYLLNNKIAAKKQKGEYEKTMDNKIELKEELEKCKQLYEQEIPALYEAAGTDEAKGFLHEDYKSAKERYLQLLKEYENEMSNANTVFKDDYVKDFVFKIEASKKEEESEDQNQTSNNFITSEEHLRKTATSLCLKSLLIYRKVDKSIFSTEENLVFNQWKNQIKENFLHKDVTFDESFNDLTVGDVFSQYDFSFFKESFSHMSIELFKSQKVSDFLVMLSFLLNPELPKFYEAKVFVESKQALLEDKSQVGSVCKWLAASLQNSLRFHTNFVHNENWQRATRLTEKDAELVAEMLSSLKSELNRRVAKRQRLAQEGLRGPARLRRPRQPTFAHALRRLA